MHSTEVAWTCTHVHTLTHATTHISPAGVPAAAPIYHWWPPLAACSSASHPLMAASILSISSVSDAPTPPLPRQWMYHRKEMSCNSEWVLFTLRKWPIPLAEPLVHRISSVINQPAKSILAVRLKDITLLPGLSSKSWAKDFRGITGIGKWMAQQSLALPAHVANRT